MMIPLTSAALDAPFSWFEMSPEDMSPRSIKIQVSSIRSDGRLQSIRAGKDIVLAFTEAGKIGVAQYFTASEVALYPVNTSSGAKRSIESYISTIDDMSARISTGQLHPRVGALGDLANHALISQSKETRSIAQWAKDLTNASFNN